MNYSRAEQETSIVWDEEEKVAHIYTASPVTMRKLDKLCSAHPEEYKRVWVEKAGERVTAAKYTAPSKRIRYGKPASQARRDSAQTAAAYSPFLTAKIKG
jgi:hypothetical protein